MLIQRTHAMQTFAYEARKEDGQLTTGLIAAEGPEQAGQQLSERNLFVVRMAVEGHRAARSEARGHATRAQVAWHMAQLSIMVKTGVRLVDALDCLARQAREPRLKALLEQVSQTVQEGHALSDAMAMYPRSFPGSLIAMIRASEMSGTMSLVLHQSSIYLLNELHVLKRIRSAVMYPLFMLGACVVVTVFLLTVILPRFAHIFASRGAILPLPTRMLMALSESLVGEWHLWVCGIGALLTGLLAWWRTNGGRKQRDFLVISTPVLSGVFNLLYQSRAFRTLAVLLDAGVPLVDTMKVVKDVVANVYYRELWRQVDEHIHRGERMSGPLLASRLIPEPVAQMIDSGDRSGKLSFVFSNLADFIEEEYNQAVKTATQFIEPCMILVMGSIIGFVAASLMLPLFQASMVIAR